MSANGPIAQQFFLYQTHQPNDQRNQDQKQLAKNILDQIRGARHLQDFLSIDEQTKLDSIIAGDIQDSAQLQSRENFLKQLNISVQHEDAMYYLRRFGM